MRNLADAMSYLNRKLLEWTPVQVRYVREGVSYDNLSALTGNVSHDAEDASGLVIRMVSKDFIIPQAFFGKLAKKHPVRGDQIWQMINGAWQVYTVNSDSLGTGLYDESDAFGVAYRVHTTKDRDYAN